MTSSCREFLLEVDQREGLLLIALSLLWVRLDHSDQRTVVGYEVVRR